MNNYITLAILFFILFPTIACSQTKNRQALVLEKILSDQSLNTFFEHKEIIKVVKNENCTFELNTQLQIGSKTIEIIEENDKTKSDALKFIGYENIRKYIVIEVTLFNKNVIYSATYKKRNGQLKEMMTNTTFIKSPHN